MEKNENNITHEEIALIKQALNDKLKETRIIYTLSLQRAQNPYYDPKYNIECAIACKEQIQLYLSLIAKIEKLFQN